jgi:predicted nucleic acid-binding protein
VRNYILDANAVITYVDGRKGAEKVESLLQQALAQNAVISMSAVNLGEAYYIVMRKMGEAAAARMVTALQHMINFQPVELELAIDAARLKQKYKLGYADSFAAALAISRDATLVSADPDFEKVGKSLKLLKLPRYVGS